MTYSTSSGQPLYYCKSSGKAYTSEVSRQVLGYDPDRTDSSILASRNLYLVNQSSPTFDQRLYDVGDPIYTIAGNVANQTWTQTAKPLAEAKLAGKRALKDAANDSAGTGDGFYSLMLIAAASKTAANRSTETQDTLDSLTTILDDLVTNIQAVEAATTVAQIDAIVNP